ncbi:Uncharacterised protein [Klebsiella pneumoniae]|nr:Uncharacterised protein [Klebsiella pneumoniae]
MVVLRRDRQRTAASDPVPAGEHPASGPGIRRQYRQSARHRRRGAAGGHPGCLPRRPASPGRPLVPVPRRFPPHPPRRLAAWGSLPDREPARSRAGGGLDPLPPALPGRRTDPQALDLLPERGRPATFARGERCVSPRPQGAGAGRARAEAAVQAHRRLDHGVAPGGPGPQSQYRPGRFPPRALRDRTEHRRLPGGRRAGQPARRPAAVPRPDLGAR